MELRTRSLVLASAVVGALLGLGPADAASSVTSGWWASSPILLAPDVADGQLLVQGGSSAEEPAAYAGVSFVLDEDEEPTSLALTVAPDSASTPAAILVLCALDAPATDAAGEPSDGAPAPACDIEVEAEPSEDGSTYTFDVAALSGEGSLDVAVLPSQPSDRVVLDAPTVASLTSTTAFEPITGGFDSEQSSPPSPPPSSSGGAARSEASSGPSSPPRPAPSVSVPPVATSAPVDDLSAPGRQEEPEEQAVAAPQRQTTPFEPAASSEPSSGNAGAGLLALGLAAAAATAWMVAGNGSEDDATEPAAAG